MSRWNNRQQPLTDDMVRHLEEQHRTESGPLEAKGGHAPRVWSEDTGAPGFTRSGIPRIYGRVKRLKGAE